MFGDSRSVDLTPQQIEVIEAALHTQEKILSMQSKASTDGRAAQQLTRLQGVLRSLRRQAPMSNGASAPWGVLGRLIGGQQQSCR